MHDVAVFWMDQITQDPRCEVANTTIGDLSELVRTALLVVELPRRLGTNLLDIPKRDDELRSLINTWTHNSCT
jgi:hypothetical protein